MLFFCRGAESSTGRLTIYGTPLSFLHARRQLRPIVFTANRFPRYIEPESFSQQTRGALGKGFGRALNVRPLESDEIGLRVSGLAPYARLA